MIRTQISILIELAARDNVIDPKEYDLISKIGIAHGMEQEEIEELFKKPEKVDYDSLELDEKFDMLCRVVQLMKVDGKIFDEEIMYCMEVAKRLGYPLEAVMELYGIVHANLRLSMEINALKRKYREYPKNQGSISLTV